MYVMCLLSLDYKIQMSAHNFSSIPKQRKQYGIMNIENIFMDCLLFGLAPYEPNLQ